MNMDGILKNKIAYVCSFWLLMASFQTNAAVGDIHLPEAETNSPIIAEKFEEAPIPFSLQTISNLLKASNESAASIQLYVVMPAGTYLYNATENELEQITDQNLTIYTKSPFTILYVGSFQKNEQAEALIKANIMGENFSQMASQMGVMGYNALDIDRMYLKKELNLGTFNDILFAQSIGFLNEAE